MLISKITWEPSETIIKIGNFGIHYYSLMFVIAFLLGFKIMKKIYKKENIPANYLDPIFIYVLISTLLGARLGEVFFYNWGYFQNNLIEILIPIQKSMGDTFLFGLIKNYRFIGYRGLASHGATIGILIGLYLYQRKYKLKSFLWILDRVVIPISLGGCFVRIGNFFNSEIVGKYTSSSFGVVFLNRNEFNPRHPAQLYEAIGYLLLFFLLQYLYKKGKGEKPGFLIGVFFIVLFSIRFIIEFVKESQGGWFEELIPVFSTGQWLSIPFIIVGATILFRTLKKEKV